MVEPLEEVMKLFLHADTNQGVTTFRSKSLTIDAESLETLEEGKVTSFVMGYIMVCHLAKPITPENKLYVHKRLKAIGYDVDDTNLTELSESRVTNLIDIAVLESIKSNLGRAKAVIPILEDTLTMESDTPFRQAVKRSFEMVFQKYGMTASEAMMYFCTLPTKAFIYNVVVDEMREFKAKYQAFKDRHGDNWKLGRLLRLSDISDIDNSKYPHLYVCAIARASGAQKGGLGNYTMSGFGGLLRENPETLRAAALTDIVGEGIITDEIAATIKEVTGKEIPPSQVGRRI